MNLKTNSFFLITVLALTNCGGGGSSGTDGAVTSNHNSFAVADVSSLPTCETSIVNQLWFVESVKSFYSCKSSGWALLDTGTLRVSSTKSIDPVSTNLCTEFSANEACRFIGGQIVRYSDGSRLLMSGFRYNFYADYGDGDTDGDTDLISISIFVPADQDYAYTILSPIVARGAGHKSLWLVYDRESDRAYIVYDSDDDDVIEETDEILITTTET